MSVGHDKKSRPKHDAIDNHLIYLGGKNELIQRVTLADKFIHLARSRSESSPFFLLKRNKTTAAAELMCSCFCGFRDQSSETEFDAHTPEFPF